MAPIRQPQAMMTSGVRHAPAAAVFIIVDCTDIKLLRPKWSRLLKHRHGQARNI
jgi:hypothetical protein